MLISKIFKAWKSGKQFYWTKPTFLYKILSFQTKIITPSPHVSVTNFSVSGLQKLLWKFSAHVFEDYSWWTDRTHNLRQDFRSSKQTKKRKTKFCSQDFTLNGLSTECDSMCSFNLWALSQTTLQSGSGHGWPFASEQSSPPPFKKNQYKIRFVSFNAAWQQYHLMHIWYILGGTMCDY